MAEVRRAECTWEGDLLSGSGRVSAATSGLFRELPVSWASRTEAPAGRTSPEELLAAAHASCFSMALSNTLAKAGTPPQRLEVSAEVTFEKVGEGWSVVASHLRAGGIVPGADAAGFAQAATSAKDGCPVSRALSPDVRLSVEAELGS